jgi:hypothetical protein
VSEERETFVIISTIKIVITFRIIMSVLGNECDIFPFAMKENCAVGGIFENEKYFSQLFTFQRAVLMIVKRTSFE